MARLAGMLFLVFKSFNRVDTVDLFEICSPVRPHWAELVIESVCPYVNLSAPSSAFFSRPLIGPEIT